MEQKGDRGVVRAGEHRLGNGPLEAGEREGSQLAPTIGGRTRVAPVGAKTASPGKGAGGGELRIGCAIVQCRQGSRGIRRADPLGREPGGDSAQRAAARHPAPRPAGGVGGVVQEPGRPEPQDEGVDEGPGRAHRIVIAPDAPPYPAL